MDALDRSPRIFISAAEQSADEHAADFIRAARSLLPGISFAGIAGPAMRDAGCVGIHDMTAQSAMGLAAVGRIPEAWRLIDRIKKQLAAERFDAAVMIDSPTLNLPIAKACRHRHLPVLYYIAPQVWAWGPWRIGRVRRRVNRMACIWPFEEPYFRARGIQATYVGHPTLDRLLATPVDEKRVAELKKRGGPLITILPGSRRHVVEEVLPGQLEIAEGLIGRFRTIRFIIVSANPEVRRRIHDHLAALRVKLPIEVVEGAADRAAAICAADVVLAASGTVTLEIAFHGTPMIVMYNHSKWAYRLIGRWIITTPHLSIPNILAGRRIVPEYMPYYTSVRPIIAQVYEMLATPAQLAKMRTELKAAMAPMLRPGAPLNAARELEAMLPRAAGA